MGNILDSIQSKVMVSDGAWGTFLQKKGLRPGECPELWNVMHRQEVLDIARNYVEAGADMIETNSFGGSRFKLGKYGLADRVAELNREAAAISREAAGPDLWVLGSIGPTGKLLLMEEVIPDELYNGFREQAVALVEGGADAIVVETMTDLEEAVIAVRAAAENTAVPVFCTMTFDKLLTGEYRTMMGVSPSEMIQPLLEAGASVLGANCGNGMEGMIAIVREIRNVNALVPILIHANAGIPVYRDGQTHFPESPCDMATHVADLVLAGANIIGGCCGTTPGHIREIRDQIQKASRK